MLNDKMELRQNKLGGAVTKHSSAMKSIIKDWAPSAAEIRYVKLVHGPTASIPAKRQQSFRAVQGIIRRPRPPSVLPHFPLTRSVPPPGGPQISGSFKPQGCEAKPARGGKAERCEQAEWSQRPVEPRSTAGAISTRSRKPLFLPPPSRTF
jgi:hypothetical protein